MGAGRRADRPAMEEVRSHDRTAVIAPHVLGRRYELRDILGTGGMGRVWRAWDALLRREVAVKTMGEGLANDRSFRLRFEREAQHAASLNHPNIVQVHDYGISGTTPYIVMELVSGETLDELISDHRLLDPPSTVRIAGHVLGALDHAHLHHIVHRDVKPQNILIADDGMVKVTDFGLAKSVTDADLTLAGNVLGTPTYISPEQASDDPQTTSSDLYSLGCVLYECLAGRPPFVGQSKVEVVDMHLHAVAPPLRALRPDLSVTLEAPIMRSLAKDPHERFESAGEMSAALETGLTSAPDVS
ncbi:MAG TPA: protein kinase, partial [Actinomycetota bacterium]|nr:protein kinase [Actinomycetota bacterium]